LQSGDDDNDGGKEDSVVGLSGGFIAWYNYTLL
jgi:hypothetical protein